MLAVWREWGVPDILREAWESGIVLTGVSAWSDLLVRARSNGFMGG